MKTKLLVFITVFAMSIALLAGCAGDPTTTPAPNGETTTTQDENGDETTTTTEDVQELTSIVMPTYRSGEDVGAVFFLPQVDRFNELYAGKYEIVIEESPSTTHGDRIKQLALQNELPPIFQIADSAWVEDYLIANDRLQDLSEFISARPEMEQLLIQDSVDFLTKEDGGIYAMPLTVLRTTGLYYNSQLFSPEKPLTQMSWDEFFTGMEADDNVVAFQTAEGGWTINLILTGIIGSIEGGPEMLQQGVQVEKLNDFNNPVMIEAFTILQEAFERVGPEHAIGLTYPDAANTFYANQSAVLPDGTWIIDMMSSENSEEWAGGFDGADVVGDYYPGNVAIANPSVYDWMVPAGLSENELELAYAFLEFINTPEEIEAFILAEGGTSPNLDYSDEFLAALAENKLLNDFATKTDSNTTFVPYFHDAITESLFLGEFTNSMTNLFNGSWTPEEFCENLTIAAQE